jgi:hypothetical protein
MKKYEPLTDTNISILAWDPLAIDVKISIDNMNNIMINNISHASKRLIAIILEQFEAIKKIHNMHKLPYGTYDCGFSSFDLSQFKSFHNENPKFYICDAKFEYDMSYIDRMNFLEDHNININFENLRISNRVCDITSSEIPDIFEKYKCNGFDCVLIKEKNEYGFSKFCNSEKFILPISEFRENKNQLVHFIVKLENAFLSVNVNHLSDDMRYKIWNERSNFRGSKIEFIAKRSIENGKIQSAEFTKFIK